MRKYKILISCMLCLVLSFSMVTPTFALGRQPIKPMAWPGRPDGNGDGSEEWMTGSYGEMNGPYKLLSTNTGNVAEFNAGVQRLRIARSVLISIATIFATPLFVVQGAITMDDVLAENLVGRYYVYKTYISGRRMKIVIDTYWGENQTDFEKHYEKEILW